MCNIKINNNYTFLREETVSLRCVRLVQPCWPLAVCGSEIGSPHTTRPAADHKIYDRDAHTRTQLFYPSMQWTWRRCIACSVTESCLSETGVAR